MSLVAEVKSGYAATSADEGVVTFLGAQKLLQVDYVAGKLVDGAAGTIDGRAVQFGPLPVVIPARTEFSREERPPIDQLREFALGPEDR